MGQRDSYSDRMTCTLRGGNAIARAAEAARSFSEIKGLEEEDSARLCIIIEELVTNLYDHGGLTGADEIELSFASEPGRVRIALTDPGTPFDLQTAQAGSPNLERGGGAGIAIVRAWADIVGYEVTAEGNRLDLLLPLAD